jgi:DNA-binding FadR family transcriptional regulator
MDLRPFTISPIPRDGSSRPHYIAERLRQKFLAGSLRPGDRVPSERELAGALQVSRSALREGLRILEAEGLLEVVHGRGTYVVDVGSRASVSRATIGAPTIVSKEIVDLFEVRRILEPEASALAAQNIRPSDAKALRRICEGGLLLAGRSAPNFERLQTLNRQFHLRILTASGNGAIERIVAGIFDLLAETSFAQHPSTRRMRALKSWAENGDHHRIADAIVRGDAETARSLMAEHLKYG